MIGRRHIGEGRLAVAAFTVGMGIMAVEITASRILAPYFGASMFVWTSLIVTILLALSIGYWAGGRLAERVEGRLCLGPLLMAAAALLIVGERIINWFTLTLTDFLFAAESAFAVLFLGSFVVSFVVFALPVFLAAAAGPVILKEWSRTGQDIGRVSGRYFALSTVGSALGTVLPTLVLVPQLGARLTTLLFAAIFLAVGALLLPRRRRLLAGLVGLPLAASLIWSPTPRSEKVIHETETPYQLIRVEQDGPWRHLKFNEGLGIQSVYAPDEAQTLMYYDYLAALPGVRGLTEDGSAVFLGLAGGSAVRQFQSQLRPEELPEMTGVEVDPGVIEVARRYFALDELPLEVVNQDARVFLAARARRHDFIFVDAYSTQIYIPPHLATVEFFRLLASRLGDGGIAAFNINAPSEDSPLLRTLLNSISAVFPEVQLVPVSGSWNYIVVASSRPFELGPAATALPAGYARVARDLRSARSVTHDPAGPVFTDDRAPVEMMTDKMVLEAFLGGS